MLTQIIIELRQVLIGLREVMTMSNMKYCQGTKCHTYDTKDRKKGSKGNKRNETRKRSSFYYGNGNFCSLQCQTDWFETHGDNAINHFGRVEQPIVLTEENAWQKQYNYAWYDDQDNQPRFHERNMVTNATRECEQ
jgi:hypothetical protein